jgi:invasion protein IalB
MRKLALAALFVAIYFAAPSNQANAFCEGQCPPPPPPKNTPQSAHGTSHGGWFVGCGMASAGALMLGTVAKAHDRNDRRQLTLNEAAWLTAVCPGFLPLALLVQATCPDNKGTHEIARLAFRFVRKHPSGNQSPFTDAYAEACSTGKLSRKTRAYLRSLI